MTGRHHARPTSLRRIVSAGVAVALGAATLVAVSEGVANAAVTSPSANAVLRGSVTLTDSGGRDNSSILGIAHCGGSVNSKIELINSAGTPVFTVTKSGAGEISANILTENYPNGSYTVRGTDGNGANSGFGGFGCKTDTVVSNVPVTIQNQVSVVYTGSTSAPQNTNTPVSAVVTDPNNGDAAVAGLPVTFTLTGGSSVIGVTNGSGAASATLPVNGPPRSTTVVAAFAGNAFFTAASRSSGFAVQQNATTTTIDPTTPSYHNQPVTFRATVARSTGTGTPTGQVQFTLDGSNFGAPVALVNGVATTPSTATLSTTTHSVGASYLGDPDFLGSTATAVNQIVLAAPTATALDSSPNPSVHGQAVTFTATVTSALAGPDQPGGGVQFFVDGQPFGTAVPVSDNAGTVTASLPISNLATGNRTVTATYNGDGDYAPSNSAAVVQGVNRSATATTVTSSDPNSVTGQSVTFTARVDAAGAGAGTPTGTVQFFVDGTALGGPVALVDGSATSPSTSSISGGVHTVSAVYSGDGDFSGSDAQLTQTVGAASTTTTVSSSVNPSVVGQPVTYTATVATVAPGSGTPGGAVQFSVDGVPVGLPVDLVDGTAVSAAIANLSRGSHIVTAAYSGSADYLASTSDPLTQVVNKAPTRTTLTSSANPAVFGQAVTFTATVGVPGPGDGSPTGTITFTDGAAVLATVPVGPDTGEQVTFTTGALTVAQHAISATYSGDDSFLTSTDSVNQVVLRAQTSTVLTSSANPAQSGQGIRFTAAVSPVAPGAGTPTGAVTFTVNGAPLGSPVQVVDGIAVSSAFATLSPGTYAIAASYAGDRNFVASSAVLDQGAGQTVTKGATTMAVSSSPNPAAFGATVTFVADVSAVAPATGTPSGVVQFYEGDVLLGAVSLAKVTTGNARASFPFSQLSPGSHAIRAVYVGNFNFTGQVASLSQDVGLIPTVTGVVAAPNPSVYGQAVTLTATVSTAAVGFGAPAGTVTFRDGSSLLGTAPLQSIDGVQRAALTVSSLHAGARSVIATYSGGGDFAPSTSAAYTQTVARATPTLVARSFITNSQSYPPGFQIYGRVQATLTGNGGAPLAGETLTFSTTQSTDGSVIHICTVVTDATGSGECDATTLFPASTLDGGYDVRFAGNADYAPLSVHQVVNDR